MNSKYIIIKMIVSRFLQTHILAQGLLQQSGLVILKTNYLNIHRQLAFLGFGFLLKTFITKYEW